jgi:hypothetical protein
MYLKQKYRKKLNQNLHYTSKIFNEGKLKNVLKCTAPLLLVFKLKSFFFLIKENVKEKNTIYTRVQANIF